MPRFFPIIKYSNIQICCKSLHMQIHAESALFQNAAVCIALTVYSVVVISSQLTDLLDQPDQFADFTSLADLTKQNNNAIAVCVFFSWIKLFKYISFNKTMTQLSSTLSRVSGNYVHSIQVSGIYKQFFVAVCWRCFGIRGDVFHRIFCFCATGIPTIWNASELYHLGKEYKAEKYVTFYYRCMNLVDLMTPYSRYSGLFWEISISMRQKELIHFWDLCSFWLTCSLYFLSCW